MHQGKDREATAIHPSYSQAAKVSGGYPVGNQEGIQQAGVNAGLASPCQLCFSRGTRVLWAAASPFVRRPSTGDGQEVRCERTSAGPCGGIALLRPAWRVPGGPGAVQRLPPKSAAAVLLWIKPAVSRWGGTRKGKTQFKNAKASACVFGGRSLRAVPLASAFLLLLVSVGRHSSPFGDTLKRWQL